LLTSVWFVTSRADELDTKRHVHSQCPELIKSKRPEEAPWRESLIDISVPLQNDVPADPPGIHPVIQLQRSPAEPATDAGFFEGLKAEDLPDGQAGRWRQCSSPPKRHPSRFSLPLSSHHEPRRAVMTIDEVPLEWCLAAGCEAGLSSFARG